MKYFKLLLIAVIVVLMVVMVGCTTVRDASGEYGDVSSRRRVYYEDPYYGNTIILQRDPYTGQLYQISPNGYGYSPLDTYGYNYNYPYNYNRGGGNYNRGNTSRVRPSTPRTQPQVQNRQNLENAKDRVLGGKRQ